MQSKKIEGMGPLDEPHHPHPPGHPNRCTCPLCGDGWKLKDRRAEDSAFVDWWSD